MRYQIYVCDICDDVYMHWWLDFEFCYSGWLGIGFCCIFESTLM
jgi:hypothetical protein